MAYAPPGSVAVNSTVPFGAQGLDQATWAAGAADSLLQGIVNETRKYGGDASKVGFPPSWPYGPLPANSVHADGSLNPIVVAQVQQYVNSPAAQQDPDFNQFVGVNFSTASPGGYTTPPLSASEQLARDQFDYTKAMNAIKLATGGGGSSSGGSVKVSAPRTSSGGSSSSSSANDLAYLDAKTQSAKDLAQQEFDLKKQLMLLQFQLDNDPNNPKLQLQRDQMAQDLSMFQQSLAQKTQSEQAAIDQQRAKTIADYSANPGDAVAREYFLRQQGAEPLGTPINIFSGQPGTQGQMTLSDLMKQQAPLLKPYLSAQVTGAPAPTTPPPPADAAPPPPAETPPPTDSTTPAFARGTGEITPDGWTRANKFITGDHPAGMPNPEVNQVRVRNGHAETKVTPLSQMMQRHRRMPMFADGTDPWAWMGTDWNQSDTVDASGNQYYDPPLAQPQAGAYQTSTAVSPTYNTSGQSQLSYSNPTTNPVVTQKTSGVQYNTSQINADPYFGTAYQGMSPGSVVTNANSPYYGMTAADAFQAQVRQGAAGGSQELGNPNNTPLTVVGPTGAMTSGGQTGADPVTNPEAFWSNDIYWNSDGSQRPVNQVAKQSDAGILTGAQMGTGATQSANPAAPGYVPPAGWPKPPTVATATNPAASPAQPTTGTPTATTPTSGSGFNPGDHVPGTSETSPETAPMRGSYTLVNGKWVPAQTQPVSGVPVAADSATGQPQTHDLSGDQTQNGQPVVDNSTQARPAVSTVPGSTVQLQQVNDQGYKQVMTPGDVQLNGATFSLKAGDYQDPKGIWLRWNPVINDYSPLMPSKVTQISNEADFWKLPPAEQQKVLTGQPTGYALTGDWRDGLLSGLSSSFGGTKGGMLSRAEFDALPLNEQQALINGTSTNPNQYSVGSATPYQYINGNTTGPTSGAAADNGLFRMGFNDPQTSMNDYAPYLLGPLQMLQGAKGTMGYGPPPDDRYAQMVLGQDPAGERWKLANDYFNQLQAEQAAAQNPATPPVTGTGTTPATGSGTPPPPATGSGTPPATGTGTPPATGTGSGTPPATGTGTPAAATQPSLSDILNQIFGLSYGSDIYQNLPALKLLSGQLSQSEYDTIANAPVDVPGLGVSLPSANQAGNYTNLSYLQQTNPDAFALLNSLYTAGNVPLSAIMAFAKSRAPLGSAYESSLVNTQ